VCVGGIDGGVCGGEAQRGGGGCSAAAAFEDMVVGCGGAQAPKLLQEPSMDFEGLDVCGVYGVYAWVVFVRPCDIFMERVRSVSGIVCDHGDVGDHVVVSPKLVA